MDQALYAYIILPLALPKTYCYDVPVEFQTQIKPGQRVEVPLKNKRYSGVVLRLESKPPAYSPRPIQAILDEIPIVFTQQLKFWEWIASYYCCTLGEVMNVALPSGLKLNSETQIFFNPGTTPPKFHEHSKKEFLLLEALQHRESMLISEIQDLLKQKTVLPILKRLMQKRLVVFHEELKDKYKPKVEDFVCLEDEYGADEQNLIGALELVSKSEKQTRALLAYIDESKLRREVPKFTIYKRASVDQSVIKALVKKGIFKVVKKEVDRLNMEGESMISSIQLTGYQEKALDELNTQLKDKTAVLLHGVTGSGKTNIYFKKIQEVVDLGGQVLYLVPEIALTTQMLNRIRSCFGNKIGFYHSRMSLYERVELWNKVLMGLSIVVGARSSLMLPFPNLELIIIDEEHDSSYKQQDPNPRYNARDASLFLGHLYGAKVILGTATPSLESLLNARQGKYGYVQLFERYGNATLPKIELVDMRIAKREKQVKSHFSKHLIDEINICLENKEQVILFQNRRGYAPTLKCMICNWQSSCPNCDVNLTVHRYMKELRCHYCNFRLPIPAACPACGTPGLSMLGFGTEKIESSLHELFPAATVARMDYDAVRSKANYESIIHRMEAGRIDILVGTQMITKGLDFDHITLVGILNADALFSFPDFRATEKAFHLLTQVSGRAGRKDKPGKVLIQTYNPENHVIQDVIKGDFENFAGLELAERRQFVYPPFYRLIQITLKHKDRLVSQKASEFLTRLLQVQLGRRVLGPSIPYVSKVRNRYIHQILLKLEKSPGKLMRAKDIIHYCIDKVKTKDGLKSVRINVDVDPL